MSLDWCELTFRKVIYAFTIDVVEYQLTFASSVYRRFNVNHNLFKEFFLSMPCHWIKMKRYNFCTVQYDIYYTIAFFICVSLLCAYPCNIYINIHRISIRLRFIAYIIDFVFISHTSIVSCSIRSYKRTNHPYMHVIHVDFCWFYVCCER